MNAVQIKMGVAAGIAAGLLLASSGCTSSKMADESSVSSKGDGKGTAPAASTAKEAGVAMVRFVNGTGESKSLAFGEAMPFTSVGARDISEYKQIPAERHEWKLMAKDGAAAGPLATDSEGPSAGKRYTVLAYLDKSGQAKIRSVSDELTPPAAGQAKVRLINLAPGNEKIDLYAGAKKDPLIAGATLDEATSFKDVDPAVAQLTVRQGMSRKNSAPVKDLNLKAGKLYTVIVFADKGGKLKVKSVEDQLNAAPNGV